MRYLYLIIVILIIGGVYFNRSYAYFFEFTSAKNLIAPIITQYQVLGSDKNDKTIKYIALGDSLTAGTAALEYQQTYPYIVAKKIAAESQAVNVLNLAQPGVKIADVHFDQQSLKDAHLITILIGTNDVFDGTSKDEFMSEYQNLINLIKSQTQGQIILLTIPYLGSDKIVILPYKAYLMLKIYQYNQVIKQLAVQNHLTVIDLNMLTGNYFDKDNTLYSADQFHPSSRGYIMWGGLINENWNFKP